MMFETDSFDFPVARPIEEVYEYLIEPANYTEWAYTSDGRMQHVAEQDWAVETSIGPRIIRFARRNAFGVLDHQVMHDRNSAPHPVGMRVVPCGAGTQVIYTSFRPPSIDALQWASTMEWVRSDLLALQSQLETRGKLAPMPASSTVSLSIRRPVDEVYAFLFDPANLVHPRLLVNGRRHAAASDADARVRQWRGNGTHADLPSAPRAFDRAVAIDDRVVHGGPLRPEVGARDLSAGRPAHEEPAPSWRTKAMRSMLVAPGVPSGMPAVMAMRSPGRAKPSL
jgi:hypothetical protein